MQKICSERAVAPFSPLVKHLGVILDVLRKRTFRLNAPVSVSFFQVWLEIAKALTGISCARNQLEKWTYLISNFLFSIFAEFCFPNFVFENFRGLGKLFSLNYLASLQPPRIRPALLVDSNWVNHIVQKHVFMMTFRVCSFIFAAGEVFQDKLCFLSQSLLKLWKLYILRKIVVTKSYKIRPKCCWRQF